MRSNRKIYQEVNMTRRANMKCVMKISMTLVLVLQYVPETSGQTLRTDSLTPAQDNPCLKTSVSSCGECTAISTLCAFCTDKEYDENNYQRCDLLTVHQQMVDTEGIQTRRCKNIVNPKSSKTFTKDSVVQDGDTGIIQIQPQEIDMTLRPNDPQHFELTFRLAENYPVDLYYLMDLSNSMADDKEKLASLGVKIAEDMTTITKNFKLGFGSFVDKVVMPYVSTAPNKINNPCPNCEKAYGFRNVLPLDEQPDLFRTRVRDAKVSGNLDAPEGGFDAIMQAITCEKDIGWRNQSRRMLLFSTDSGFHYSGDGKLGGILKPNDGACHLDGAGMYTESSNQDYPSISQVATKAKEKNVNIIFAVTKDQKKIYEQLEPIIAGSETGELASDSQNIVKLVRENYLKITSKVELIVENSDDVEVKFRSKCKGSVETESNRCDNLKIGDTVKFNVSIEAKSCPKDGSMRKQLRIKPVGLSDTLTISLNTICQCDCEKPEIAEKNKNHEYCNFNGTFVCGLCKCNEQYYGKTCTCDKGQGTIAEKEAECIQPNTTLICSGRGYCSCGKCECKERQAGSNQKYTGTFCECDDFSCPYYKGLACGGNGHGACKCGSCFCMPGYKGRNCGCSTDNSTCMYNGAVCNGKGTCDCGKCTCDTKDIFGPQCQECDNCGEQCRNHRDCAQCIGFETGKYASTTVCDANCKNFTERVPKLIGGIRNCEAVDDDGCFFYFTYFYDSNDKIKVQVRNGKDCPPEVPVLGIVLGVLFGFVALGLIALGIWKLYTTWNDRRELANFLKEAQNAQFATGENPIYRKATKTYQNPTYGKK